MNTERFSRRKSNQVFPLCLQLLKIHPPGNCETASSSVLFLKLGEYWLKATYSIHHGVVQFQNFSARSGTHVQYSFKTTPAPSPMKAPKLTSLLFISHADVARFHIVCEREIVRQSLVRNNTLASHFSPYSSMPLETLTRILRKGQ